MPKIRPMVRFSAVVVSTFMVAALINCGVKGNPVPQKIVSPALVTDLKAAPAKGSVVLSWTMPEVQADFAAIRISRSELEILGEECPGCPRQYVLIADLYSRDSRILKGSGAGVRYIDSTVKPGRLYTYKLVICDSYRNCSGESNQTELKIKE